MNPDYAICAGDATDSGMIFTAGSVAVFLKGQRIIISIAASWFGCKLSALYMVRFTGSILRILRILNRTHRVCQAANPDTLPCQGVLSVRNEICFAASPSKPDTPFRKCELSVLRDRRFHTDLNMVYHIRKVVLARSSHCNPETQQKRSPVRWVYKGNGPARAAINSGYHAVNFRQESRY